MINHCSPASDGHSRQRIFPMHRNPKPSSINVKLAFFVDMIFLARLKLKYWTLWTPSRRPRGWREPLWHQPDWVPGSIFVPSVGHYRRLYVDLTPCAQHVSSVAEHGTNALLNLIFSYFYGQAVSPRLQALTVHLMSRVSNRQSPLDQQA